MKELDSSRTREEMTNHLLITVDTEIDKSKVWKVSSNESFSSVTTEIPEKLGKLFSWYSAKPTYLLSPEAIRNEARVSILKSLKPNFDRKPRLVQPHP